MTDILQFPRPLGVPSDDPPTEYTLDDPTLAEALDLTWYTRSLFTPTPFRDLTLAELVEVSRFAQWHFRNAVQDKPARPADARRFWRAMRGAQLVIVSRSVQKLGGPFHA